MDYNTMPAGREMDALVAEMMGWILYDPDRASANIYLAGSSATVARPYDSFKPSTDIAPAWEVMEKMATYQGLSYPEDGADEAAHRDYSTWPSFESQFYGQVLTTMTAQEAALHICRAALKARL